MRYIKSKSIFGQAILQVVGTDSNGDGLATSQTLESYRIEGLYDDEGNITLKSVTNWVKLRIKDFSEVYDFRLEPIGDMDVPRIEWWDEESDFLLGECLSDSDYEGVYW